MNLPLYWNGVSNTSSETAVGKTLRNGCVIPMGGSVYLRLSTRPIHQLKRNLSPEQRTAIIEGGYWVFEPETNAELALIYFRCSCPGSYGGLRTDP